MSPNSPIPKFHVCLLTGLFALVNGLLYWKVGVVEGTDSAQYLGYAEEVCEKGFFLKPHYQWYLGYVLFLVAIQLMLGDLQAVIGIQLLLSFGALWALYRSGQRLYGSSSAGLVGALYFLGFAMISYWNMAIYAESLLISLCCFSVYWMVKWQLEGLAKWEVVAFVCTISWTLFVKPTGIAVLVAVLIAWVTGRRKAVLRRKLYGLLAIFLGLLMLVLINEMLATYTFVRDYQLGEIIFEARKLTGKSYASLLMLEPPANLWLPAETAPPLIKLVSLVVMNPWYSAKLIGMKLGYFLLYIRPYYSWGHNILALVLLLPAYFSAAKAVSKKEIPAAFKVFCSVFLMVNMLSCCLMTIDWRSRFLMPILPMVFLLASGPIAERAEKIYSRLTYQRVNGK